jgi:hypothetical protein
MEALQSVWPQAVAKAWHDDMFRQELLADAPAALKNHFSFDVPPGVSLTVIEDGRTTATTIVLPRKPCDLDEGFIELDRPDILAGPACCCC